MRLLTLALLCLFISGGAAHADEPGKPQLEVLAKLDQRPGNVAVALDKRVFVTMHPFDKQRCKLMEVKPDGKLVPFPNEKISCEEPGADGMGLYRPLGIRASLRYALMILDMGTDKVPPRIMVIGLGDNKVMEIYPIPQELLTPQSFLQDFAIDWTDNTIFIADMGQADLTKPAEPAILVIYHNPLQSPRRVLAGHDSVMPPTEPMQAEGKPVTLKNKDGAETPLRLGLNPVTIDPQNDWLYYGPMGAGKIYRVSLTKIKNIRLKPAELAASVEVVGDKPPSDGMTVDAEGNIYLTGVNANEIGILRPGKPYETYLKDERLIWPDGFAFGPEGMLYVTVNQLNRAAALNGGTDHGVPPYLVARFKPVITGTVGR